MTLQQQAAQSGGRGGRLPRGASGRLPSGVIPRRYRPKRLVDPARRRQEEVERARRLSTQFVHVQELKERIRDGDESVVPAWMAAAQELIDDFRSYRKFYSWDNYLKFLGRSDDGVQIHQPGEESGLDAIRQRLSKGERYGILHVSVSVLTRLQLSYRSRARMARRAPPGRTPRSTRASRSGTGLICSSTTPSAWRRRASTTRRTGCARRPRTRRCLPSTRTTRSLSTLPGAVSANPPTKSPLLPPPLRYYLRGMAYMSNTSQHAPYTPATKKPASPSPAKSCATTHSRQIRSASSRSSAGCASRPSRGTAPAPHKSLCCGRSRPWMRRSWRGGVRSWMSGR